MSPQRARFSWGLLAGVFGIGLTITLATTQDEKPRSVEELIPANTVVFFGQDGSAKHTEAWEKTAAYESMYKSGMVGVVEKIFEWIIWEHIS